jgi:hypothetical protein
MEIIIETIPIDISKTPASWIMSLLERIAPPKRFKSTLNCLRSLLDHVVIDANGLID